MILHKNRIFHIEIVSAGIKKIVFETDMSIFILGLVLLQYCRHAVQSIWMEKCDGWLFDLIWIHISVNCTCYEQESRKFTDGQKPSCFHNAANRFQTEPYAVLHFSFLSNGSLGREKSDSFACQTSTFQRYSIIIHCMAIPYTKSNQINSIYGLHVRNYLTSSINRLT